MKRLVATLFVSVLLAGCQSNSGVGPKGYRSTRSPLVVANQLGVPFKNPNQTAWVPSTRYLPSSTYTQIFECHDAACAPPSVIFFRNLSFNREKIYGCNCTEQMTKYVQENIAKSGKNLINPPQKGKYKSYDTIYFTWSRTYDNQLVEGFDLWVLFGKREFIIEGRSPTRAASQKAVEHFLAMVEIDDADPSN
jgi:hypothetical protein